MLRNMKILMLATDIGFIVYWLVTMFHLIPPDQLFRDYTNPILIHWNWSFFPLDILISLTGITSILLYMKGRSMWLPLAIISLTLTSVSGLQAIAFWLFAQDFSWTWWVPNLFLLCYPLFFLPYLMKYRGLAEKAS